MYLIRSMGKKQSVIKNSSSNFDHQVRNGRMKTKKLKLETEIIIYSHHKFNVYSICDKHTFKTYYSVLNSSVKDFLINSSSMMSYAYFQIWQSSCASFINMLIQRSLPLIAKIYRDLSPQNGEPRSSENFSILPKHLQSGCELSLSPLGESEVVHQLVCRCKSLNTLLLYDRNDVLLKKVVVTGTRNRTGFRTMSSRTLCLP